jgi:hypothetical protein
MLNVPRRSLIIGLILIVGGDLFNFAALGEIFHMCPINVIVILPFTCGV